MLRQIKLTCRKSALKYKIRSYGPGRIQTNFKIGWFQNVWKNQIARPEVKYINKIYGRISVLVKCKCQSHRGNFSGKNETCHAAERGNLHYDCTVVVTCYSASANPVVWVCFNDRKMVKRG